MWLWTICFWIWLFVALKHWLQIVGLRSWKCITVVRMSYCMAYLRVFRHLVHIIFTFSSFQEWANAMARRPSSVCPSVRPSLRLSVNFCANRFLSQTNGRIATKLAHDGLQVSVHCIQDVLKVKVKIKGHMIRALFWILRFLEWATPSLTVWLYTFSLFIF